MRRSFALPAEPQPFSAINTTPLIDVMLVLLIMMILTIPLSTHSVPIDLPTIGTPDGPPPPVHRLDIDMAGTLSWDGAPIAEAALAARLAAMRDDPARPVLHMKTAAETRYERFDQILAEVKRAGIDRLGFVGNERFANDLR